MAHVGKIVDAPDVDECFHTHPWKKIFPYLIEIHISIPITPYAISRKSTEVLSKYLEEMSNGSSD